MNVEMDYTEKIRGLSDRLDEQRSRFNERCAEIERCRVQCEMEIREYREETKETEKDIRVLSDRLANIHDEVKELEESIAVTKEESRKRSTTVNSLQNKIYSLSTNENVCDISAAARLIISKIEGLVDKHEDSETGELSIVLITA